MSVPAPAIVPGIAELFVVFFAFFPFVAPLVLGWYLYRTYSRTAELEERLDRIESRHDVADGPDE